MDSNKDIPVVILCGGKGTRLKEHTDNIPKPLVPIGDKPILWHIMKMYSMQGYKNFVLCLGYKGHLIKEYFLNYGEHHFDIEVNPKKKEVKRFNEHEVEDWNIKLIDTGEESNTGLRIYRIKKYLKGHDKFMLTYGDGVADVNLDELISFHEQKNKLVTVTGVHGSSRYGQIKTDEQGIVESFIEKPLLADITNAGFMVINKDFLEHILLPLNVPLEEVLLSLAETKQLALYAHNGFWYSMDTYRDFEELNKMWNSGRTPWKTW